MFRIGLSGQMFDDLSIWDHLVAASLFGYEGVELRSTHVKPSVPKTELKDIRSYIMDKGLVVSCLSCFIGNFGLRSDDECEKSYGELKWYVDLACFFDADMIRVWPAWQESSSASESVWNRAAFWMKKSATYAKRNNKRIVMEMHHGTLCDTASSSNRLLDMIGEENVGITLDPVNLYQVPTEYGEKAIKSLKNRIFNVHIKDIVELQTEDFPYSFPYSFYIDHIGQFTTVIPPKNLEKERYYCHRRINAGGVDWAHVLTSLKRHGYRGWLTVESVSEADKLMPSGKDLAEACYHDTMALLEVLF